LTAEEVALVRQLMTGAFSLEALDRLLREQGVSFGVDNVRRTLGRLHQLGALDSRPDVAAPVLTESAPSQHARAQRSGEHVAVNVPAVAQTQVTATPAPGTARELHPNDRVPAFRADLKLSGRAANGVFQVSDPTTGKSFALYDFEVSLARMLNGQRTFQELIEAGARLGVPTNADTLRSFIRQLDTYGFLADQPSEAGGSTWARREEWDPQTRQLFSSGMRLLWQGKPVEAARYFEAILELDPKHAESREMLDLARSHLRDSPDLALSGGPSPQAGSPSRLGATRLIAAAVAISLVAGATAAVLLKLLSGSGAVAERLPAGGPAAPPPPVARTEPVIPVPVAVTPELVVDAGAASPVGGPGPAGVLAVADGASPDAGPCSLVEPRHPPVQVLYAPTAGIMRWSSTVGGLIKPGQQVAVVISRSPNPQYSEQEHKVKELEGLAQKDTEYAEFLADARRRLAQTPRNIEETHPITATAAGLILRNRPNGVVAAKEVVGRVTDPKRWLLRVATKPAPPPGAACRVARTLSDELPAECRFLLENDRTYVEVDAARVTWLTPKATACLIAQPR
jgi:hypothetical protein